MTMTQPEARTAWEAYASIWKLAGPETKRSACAQALDDECVYTDPITQRRGWDALVEYMVEFHQQVPGGYFVTTDFKAHNGRSVASWNMLGADGSVLGTGISYGEYSDSGKVRTMTGFFETPEQS